MPYPHPMDAEDTKAGFADDPLMSEELPTIDLPIPLTAAERHAARSMPPAPVSGQWLEQLCAHIDEGGLIGEPAARDLLQEVLRLRKRCDGCDGHECDNGCAYPGVSR